MIRIPSKIRLVLLVGLSVWLSACLSGCSWDYQFMSGYNAGYSQACEDSKRIIMYTKAMADQSLYNDGSIELLDELLTKMPDCEKDFF